MAGVMDEAAGAFLWSEQQSQRLVIAVVYRGIFAAVSLSVLTIESRCGKLVCVCMLHSQRLEIQFIRKQGTTRHKGNTR